MVTFRTNPVAPGEAARRPKKRVNKYLQHRTGNRSRSLEIAHKFLAERVRKATRSAVGFPNPINTQFCDISPVVEGDPVLFRAVVEAMAGLL